MASPPRRRRPAAHNSAIVPPVPAAESVEPAPLVHPASPVSTVEPAVPAFPPALFAQLVQQVAAEVIKQLQPTYSVQGPQAASPASASFPGAAGTTFI